MRHTTKGGAVVETILILAGLALLVKAGMIWTSTYKLAGLAEHTQGVVNAVEDGGFVLDIQFADSNAGGMVFSQTGLLFDKKVGQPVPVLYNPENPAMAAMDDPRALWFMPFVLGIPGLLLVIFGFRLRGTHNL